MEDTILHDRENAEDLNQHLKDNGEKFSRQCVMVLQILYRGGRYTGKQINDMLGIACGDRRLRDLFVAKKDVRREWIKTPDGKTTKWKEYWLEIPHHPTKTALTASQQLNTVEETLVTIFSLPDDKNNIQSHIQQPLNL